MHTCDICYGSSVSPICTYEDQFIIGIHKQGHKKHSINYGTFIGIILDELENEKFQDGEYYKNKPYNYENFLGFIENNDINNNNDEEIYSNIEKYCFVKEYKNEYYNHHKAFSKF